MVLMQTKLPPAREMHRAFESRNSSYDGIFITAVQTTGIFCRPSCPAKKPNRNNVEFFPSTRDALFAGYRPCKRCRPMEPSGVVPSWIRPLVSEVEANPAKRWNDSDLRAQGLDPSRVRRWFKANHGMTFHAYQRGMRLGNALEELRNGGDINRTAFDHGYESLSGFRQAFKQIVGDAPGRSRGTEQVYFKRMLTPLGPMLAAATEQGVCLLEFADRRMLETQLRRLARHLRSAVTPGSTPILGKLEMELGEYFAGELREFTTPLVILGTAFQRTVWELLRGIPYGQTRSYADQARVLGRPEAVRAAARANGDNPIAILIPCHRVVGSDGQLTGYGGGLWRKRFLLDLERRATAQ